MDGTGEIVSYDRSRLGKQKMFQATILAKNNLPFHHDFPKDGAPQLRPDMHHRTEFVGQQRSVGRATVVEPLPRDAERAFGLGDL